MLFVRENKFWMTPQVACMFRLSITKTRTKTPNPPWGWELSISSLCAYCVIVAKMVQRCAAHPFCAPVKSLFHSMLLGILWYSQIFLMEHFANPWLRLILGFWYFFFSTRCHFRKHPQVLELWFSFSHSIHLPTNPANSLGVIQEPVLLGYTPNILLQQLHYH